jgi:hypothetical protein
MESSHVDKAYREGNNEAAIASVHSVVGGARGVDHRVEHGARVLEQRRWVVKLNHPASEEEL